MTYPVKSPKKLIEVALPLDEINKAAAREKSIRHGHPSTLHLWWARRPLAAARAVIFAQLVNDPSWKWELENPGQVAPGHLKASWAAARKRLFSLIEELVRWESTTKEDVLERARAEIRKSWREVCELNRDHPQAAELFDPDRLPALHDPFAGGGAIPLEAQRLGLEAYASDLNPVAVLINKAMIEIPPKFAGRPPVSLAARKEAAKEHKERKGKQESLFALSALSGGEVEEAARGMAAKEHKERKGKQESLFALSALSGGDSAWPGATGLAEDVRYYGAWMREKAQKRIGHLYPTVAAVQEADGAWRHATSEDIRHSPSAIRHLTVIAWLWARTVKSPNPAFSHVDVPLASTFILSSKPGKEAYVQPVIVGDRYEFTVKVGTPPPEAKEGTKLARGANFRCVMSNTAIEDKYIKTESMAGRMGVRLMAVVAEGKSGRIYLAPTREHEEIAQQAVPVWKPDQPMNRDTTNLVSGRGYGFFTWADLFTSRQLVALTTFSDLVAEAREQIRQDALAAGLPDDGPGLDAGGTGALAYAEAVSVYLAMGVDRSADFWSNLCIWANQPKNELVTHLFGRQAIPMAWDFGETNPFSESGGNFAKNLDYVIKGIQFLPGIVGGKAKQINATANQTSVDKVISTDPPYYDNIAYADLSDYFYVWLRRSLRPAFPALFATMAVPKAEELVATPYRHGSKDKAEAFFLDGMTQAMHSLAGQAHPAAPLTIYYAFKQSDTETVTGTSSTGWETFLEAVNRAGLQLTGTWPMRTERQGRMIGNDTNALASSIVLVCRKRPADAPVISRREFLRQLNAVLPEALDEMTKGSGDERSPVAPVDLSQAIIGPGMAVFSKYAAVLEADGTPMSVRTALQLINRFLAEDDFDADTQFCLHWFEQHGWREGVYGQADVLARAKGTSVDGMRAAGVVESGGGVVRLRKWGEYPADWDPQTDTRNPVWETLHQLIRALKQEGDSGAGRLLAAVRGKAEAARQLAYRLYTLCERQGWAEDARAYNELITSWDGVELAAAEAPTKPVQSSFLE